MGEPDETIARLEALGAATPPPPSDGLAERLRADRLPSRAAARPRPLITLGVALPSAAVAALVLGFVLLAFGSDRAPETFVVREAANASVSLGQHVADGDQVDIDAGGQVTIDGKTFGPGSYVVRRGRLVPLGDQATATTTSTSTTTVAPTTTTVPGSPTTRPPATAPSTTVAPTAPAPTRPPSGDLPVVLSLVGARTQRGTVALHWSRYEGGDFGGYVVRRATEIILRAPNQDRLDAVDRYAPAEETGYVIVVVDAARHPIARSNVIRL